jgi:hypothetical protein
VVVSPRFIFGDIENDAFGDMTLLPAFSDLSILRLMSSSLRLFLRAVNLPCLIYERVDFALGD